MCIRDRHINTLSAVASLAWVTPGAATEGVTPIFFSWRTWRPFLLIAVTITNAFYCSFTPRYHPTPFLPVRPRFSTILCKFAHKNCFSFGCHPAGGCHPGRSPRPSPSDATDWSSSTCRRHAGTSVSSAVDRPLTVCLSHAHDFCLTRGLSQLLLPGPVASLGLVSPGAATEGVTPKSCRPFLI